MPKIDIGNHADIPRQLSELEPRPRCDACDGRGTLPPTNDEQRYGASGLDFHVCYECDGNG